MTQGYIHSLESFGSVDGPGVRYLIFTTGCAMRCQFCHNPDTWNMNSGTLYTADELIDKAWKYRTYWGSKGGITVSGGEPLLQIDFLLELFQKAKERVINTTLDTCGNPFTREEPFFSKFQELMKVTDLVMLDIKHIDDEQHAVDAEEHLPDGALFADIAHPAQELLSGFLHGQNLLVVYHTKKAAG